MIKDLHSKPPYDMDIQRKVKIVKDLFVTERCRRGQNIPRQTEVTPFTEEELQTAAAYMKGKKVAGPDGIPPEVIKEVVRSLPRWTLEILNKLLGSQRFPVEWNRARVTLIFKQRKDPVCLIQSVGSTRSQ